MKPMHPVRFVSAALLLASPTVLNAQAAVADAPAAAPPATAPQVAAAPRQDAQDAAAKAQAKAAVDAALQEALAAKRRVLVRIVSPGCGWCKLLANTLSEDETLKQTVADHYGVVDVQWKYRDCGAFGSESLQVPSIPFLLVLDAEGQIVCRQKTEPFETKGGYDTAKLNEFLLKNAMATDANVPASPSTAP